MDRIKYFNKLSDTSIDAVYKDIWFQYKINLHNLRGVQSALVRLARILNDNPEKKAILILDDTRISSSRLQEEWIGLSSIFQSSIFSRLGLLVFSGGFQQECLGKIDEALYPIAIEIQKKLRVGASELKRKAKTDAHFEILRVLLIQWFRRTGPMPIYELTAATGFSYPTIAKSLNKLQDHLYRQSDRSVELRSFPREEWLKLISQASDNRNSKGFVANRPRPMEHLLERLQEVAAQEVALGGISGVRYYMPDINMLGIPRLDITVHRWDESKIKSLARKIDPGLREVVKGELPQIAIHQLHRQESFFTTGPKIAFADEVDCLLDLYEARLEGQAMEFLDYLIKKTKS